MNNNDFYRKSKYFYGIGVIIVGTIIGVSFLGGLMVPILRNEDQREWDGIFFADKVVNTNAQFQDSNGEYITIDKPENIAFLYVPENSGPLTGGWELRSLEDLVVDLVDSDTPKEEILNYRFAITKASLNVEIDYVMGNYRIVSSEFEYVDINEEDDYNDVRLNEDDLRIDSNFEDNDYEDSLNWLRPLPGEDYVYKNVGLVVTDADESEETISNAFRFLID